MIEEADRADRDHPVDVGVVAVRGKDEHLGAGTGGEDLPRGLEAVEQRHRDVHDDDVGPERGQLHRLPAVVGFADDLDLAVGKEQGAQALADDRVVVGQQGLDRFSQWHGRLARNPLPRVGSWAEPVQSRWSCGGA